MYIQIRTMKVDVDDVMPIATFFYLGTRRRT